jgi:hypothetical protein
LENLRQELSYSDTEEVGLRLALFVGMLSISVQVVLEAGDWNNERAPHRDFSSLAPLRDMEHNKVSRQETENGVMFIVVCVAWLLISLLIAG